MFEYLLFLPLLVQFILGVSSVFLLYRYTTRNHDYWKKKGVPYSQPFPLVGTVYEGFASYFHGVEEKRYKKHGSIYGHFASNKPVLSVADPLLLRDILVKDSQFFYSKRNVKTGDSVADNMLPGLHGEDLKRVRSVITPTFTTGRIKGVLNTVKDCSNTLVHNFHISAKDGKPVDAKKIYGAFTMDAISSSNFSTKLDSHHDPENKFMQAARAFFCRDANWRSIMFMTFPRIMKFFNISVFATNSLKFFKNVSLQLIEERRKTGQKRNDFLQLLLDSANDEESEQKCEKNGHKNGIAMNGNKNGIAMNGNKNGIAMNGNGVSSQQLKTTTNKSVSMDKILGQCVFFFTAAYDTTASTLAFSSYLLALNPDKQDLLREEVDQVLNKCKGEITYEMFQEMKYLDNVISEALRLFPPIIRGQRVAGADYKLGDTGITVPKGMGVTIPIYAMHRDPKIYPDPEKFEPERFSAEERALRDQYTYLPFGAGPRNCVAMRFALMIVKMALVNVIANFNIKSCPETKVPLDFYCGQVTLQPKEIILQLEARTEKPLIK